MEVHAPIPFPRVADAADEAVLTEIDVAIALVVGGVATRVRVASIELGAAERLAGVATARAQASGLRFVMERSAWAATFTIGPSA